MSVRDLQGHRQLASHIEEHSGTVTSASQSPANDNGLPRLPAPASAFPCDALARIERRARSAMTSAPAQPQEWYLTFDRRSAPSIEPLMGWTGGSEPLAQLELKFPTLEQAVAYAQRQGLRYSIHHDVRSRTARDGRAQRRRVFSDATLGRLGLRRLQGTYGNAMAGGDVTPPPPLEPSAQHSAMDIVRDPNLSVDDKRSMLMNRAYDEYLLDQQAPANGTHRLRILEIEAALFALERSQWDRSSIAS